MRIVPLYLQRELRNYFTSEDKIPLTTVAQTEDAGLPRTVTTSLWRQSPSQEGQRTVEQV